jgi:hypothetical protein
VLKGLKLAQTEVGKQITAIQNQRKDPKKMEKHPELGKSKSKCVRRSEKKDEKKSTADASYSWQDHLKRNESTTGKKRTTKRGQ